MQGRGPCEQPGPAPDLNSRSRETYFFHRSRTETRPYGVPAAAATLKTQPRFRHSSESVLSDAVCHLTLVSPCKHCPCSSHPFRGGCQASSVVSVHLFCWHCFCCTPWRARPASPAGPGPHRPPPPPPTGSCAAWKEGQSLNMPCAKGPCPLCPAVFPPAREHAGRRLRPPEPGAQQVCACCESHTETTSWGSGVSKRFLA